MGVLVTGGYGFIGSNFIRHYLQTYPSEHIINLDKLTYAANIKNLEDIKTKNYTFVKGDICDASLVEELLKKCQTIIHFAAESHVDNSIFASKVFTQTNVLGTHTLLEAARKNNIKEFIHVSCYDEKTKALTTMGLKNYHELKKGDVVFSLNKKTGQLEEKRIEEVIIQDYDGKMIHFKSNRVDLLVTPDHRVYYKKRYCKGDTIYVDNAKNIFKRTKLKLPDKTEWTGVDKDFILMESIGLVSTSDLFYLSGVFIGDGFNAYQEKKVETKSGLNRKDWLGNARDKLGKFYKIKKQSSYKTVCKGYRIFFDVPEKDKARKRLEDTLKKLEIKFSAHKGESGEHIYFSSKYWMKHFEQFGKHAKNKYIPRWMLKYNKKYLKYLFDGLIDSDGYKRKFDFQYTTISPKLLSSITELGYKLGFRVVYRKNYVESYINNRKIKGGAYYIYFSRQSKGIGKENAKIEPYKGKIWCVKVQDNKNLIVERNGKFDFCGNTDEVYGSIEKGSFKETDALRPNSPYAASKAGADLLCRAYFKTYGLPIKITRCTNNYGPYQHPEKLIPKFVTYALQDKQLPLYGTGKNVRDWIYVDDHCKALDVVLKKGESGEIYNIGASNEIPNKDITKKILHELKKPESLIMPVEDRKGHDLRYSLDSTKIKKLGWKPEADFEAQLKKTIEWYKKNKGWWKHAKNEL